MSSVGLDSMLFRVSSQSKLIPAAPIPSLEYSSDKWEEPDCHRRAVKTSIRL